MSSTLKKSGEGKESPQLRQRKAGGENLKGSQEGKSKGGNLKGSQDKKKGNGGQSTNTNVLVNAPDSAAGGSFLQKLLKRLIVGFLLLSLLTCLVLSDHLYVSIAVVVVQAVVFKEIISLRLRQDKQVPYFRAFNWYFFVISLVYVYGKPFLQYLHPLIPTHVATFLMQYHLSISFTLYCFGFVASILTLKSGMYKHQFTQIAWTLMTLVMIVAQSSVVIINIFDGLIWFLLPSSLIIFNDIMAYFCGVLFGRKIIKRPFLAISPNKTWEGFIGAAFCTVIFGFFFAQLLSQFLWFICPKEDFSIGSLDCSPAPIFVPTEYHLPTVLVDFLHKTFAWNITSVTLIPMQLHAMWLALFASIVAPFGGFYASGLKRAYGIKDFDSLFPGHGGMTDRMDCQLLMGMCVYVHLRTFVNLGGVTVTDVLESAALLSRSQQVELYEQLGSLIASSM